MLPERKKSSHMAYTVEDEPEESPSLLDVDIGTINEVKKWSPLIELLSVAVFTCGIVRIFFAYI